MIVAGIGCRAGASADEIEAALTAALAQAKLGSGTLNVIATAPMKSGEAGIFEAAAALGARLVVVPQADLEAAEPRTVTRSDRVQALAGVSSVAEAAALAAAGPDARLLVPRVAVGPATCALAISGDAS